MRSLTAGVQIAEYSSRAPRFQQHRRSLARAVPTEQRSPTWSKEVDTAPEIGVVECQLLADKIIGGSGAKIMDCRSGMPHRRQVDLTDLADPVDPRCPDS